MADSVRPMGNRTSSRSSEKADFIFYQKPIGRKPGDGTSGPPRDVARNLGVAVPTSPGGFLPRSTPSVFRRDP
jgi:hypothetical protein